MKPLVPTQGEAAERVIRVRAFPDAMAGPHVDFEVPWGATIAEIVEAVPLRPEHEARRGLFAVEIDGHRIFRQHWRRVRPAAYAEHRPIMLVVRLALRGGGSGGGGGARKILSSVAAIALIGASLFVGGGGLAFLGALGSKLVAGGLALGASLALQGLAPRPAQPGQQDSGSQVGFAGATNDFAPGSSLPRVIGTHRVAPPIVVPPFTTVDGDDQLVTIVYGLAGPHAMSPSSIRIGDTGIPSDGTVEYEIRNGFPTDTHLTFVDRTIIESAPNVRMSEHRVKPDDGTDNRSFLLGNSSENLPKWHRVETRDGPERFVVGFVFDQGLGYNNSDGNPRATGVWLRGRFRLKGTSTWIGLPRMLVKGRQRAKAVRVRLAFEWVDSVPSTASGAKWPIDSGGVVTDNKLTGWAGLRDEPTESVPSAWYTRQQSGGTYYAGVGYSAEEIIFYLSRSLYEQGRYEFEFQRSHPFGAHGYDVDATSGGDYFRYDTAGDPRWSIPVDVDRHSHALALQTVQSIFPEYPIADDGEFNAYLAIRARNQQVERVTVEASGYVEAWDADTETWVDDQISSNPADWYRDVLIGELNAEPVPEELVDMAALADWAEWCVATGKRVNAVVQGKSVYETLQMIALAGWGAPVFGALFSIIPDRLRTDGPVGLITLRNAADFSFEKPFPIRPHALRVTYADAAQNYEAQEIIVYAEGYNANGAGGQTEASRFETVSYEGITSAVEARQRAELDLLWAEHRSTLHQFTMDIEHLEFTRGDLVWIEHDILGASGGRGRVSEVLLDGEGLVSGLILDEERDFTASDAAELARAAAIRCADGTVRYELVTDDDGDPARILFETPFAMPVDGDEAALIGEGTLVAILGGEGRKVLIWDIAPGPDMSAQIVCVDYAADAIYNQRRFRGFSVAVAASSVAFVGAHLLRSASVAEATSGIRLVPDQKFTPSVQAASQSIVLVKNGRLRFSSDAVAEETAVFEAGISSYVTDFEEYTAGLAPPDWTLVTSSGSVMTVEEVGGTLSGKVLRCVWASGDFARMIWNDVPATADAEVYARIRFVGTAGILDLMGLLLRRQSSTGAFYVGTISWSDYGQTNWVYRSTDGSNLISLDANGEAISNAWFDVRFRVEGSAVKMRRWLAGDAEPGAWDVEVTDTNLAAAGSVGLLSLRETIECQYFAVGVDGASAPAP